MRIKTFQANTMPDALAQARAELGEDAIVLNSKYVKAGGVLGLVGSTRVELMAAVDDLSVDSPQSPAPQADMCGNAVPARAAVSAYVGSVKEESAGPVEATANMKQIQDQINDLGEVVRRLLTAHPQPGNHTAGMLVELGIDDKIASGGLADLSGVDNGVEMAYA